MGSRSADGQGRLSGHLALVVVQILFGLFPIFGRWALAADGFTPSAVASWRIGCGALVFGALAWAVHGRRMIVARADVPRLLWCAVLGVALNQGLFLEGLERSTAINAGLLICLIPVFTFAISALVRQEEFAWIRALGVGIAFVGTVPLFLDKGPEVFGQYALGNSLMVVNSLCYSIFLVASKPLLVRYPALVVVAWVYLGAALSLPWFLREGAPLPVDLHADLAWWSLAYAVVFATIATYGLNTFALGRVRASTTAFYIYAQPIITGVAAHFLLREHAGPRTMSAAGLLFVGLFFVTRRVKRPRSTGQA